MFTLFKPILESHEKEDLRGFLYQLRQGEKHYLLRNDLMSELKRYYDLQHELQAESEVVHQSSHLNKLIYYTQEIILEGECAYLVVRPTIGSEEAFQVSDDLSVVPISVQELLALHDRWVNRSHPNDGDLLEIDVRPFYDYAPVIRDSKNIGKGVQFLNRYLSSNLFNDANQGRQALFSFLSLHQYNGAQLLINERIQTVDQLVDRLSWALTFLADRPQDEAYAAFRFDLQAIGFEPGWGNTVGRVRESLELVEDLLNSPNPQALESFLSRTPMMFRIVLVSPHGWFGQEGVLGRPDTGGQVVYVLDQARSLEKQLQEDMDAAGLDVLNAQANVVILTRLIPESEDTRCDQRLEKVYGSTNVWILRVPFREFNANITNRWISRFEIWPYLETYTIDAERELLAHLQGKPDLIVGNYSDGNLVAFLLARRLRVTQCNIAHALEKSKYLFSNLHWQDLEDQYHFSLQFTADLIAMNAANFVVSSTRQEIVGTAESVGQYESYKAFSMPELYHVVDGVELFSPKFNVVPPGVNEQYFFPYAETQRRLAGERDRLESLLFTLEDSGQVYGTLEYPQKRPLFSMARLDRVKNLTGLVECFGQSPALQDRCNLILVAGKLHVEDNADREEASEIEILYRLIDRYNLHNKIRWLGVRLSKSDTGEIYRVIADHRGIFVQPALFEAFGLTVLEAMITGLPTFATQFGGPLEIIQDRINGYYINPTDLEGTAKKLIDFVDRCDRSPDAWEAISKEAIHRVYSTYTWKIHTQKLLSLARIYGFWNFTSREKREDLLRYLESLFYLLFKPRAKQLQEQHQHR
jgi:sucrose synthase